MEIWKMRKDGESWRKEHLPIRLGGRSVTSILEEIIRSRRTGKFYLVFSDHEIRGIAEIGGVLIGGRGTVVAETILSLTVRWFSTQRWAGSVRTIHVPQGLKTPLKKKVGANTFRLAIEIDKEGA